MSTSQGLTSLKPPRIEPSVVSPDKNQDTAVTLQNTIRLLQKKQEDLLLELRNLARTSAETKKRTKEEIDELKKQKRNLLVQIKSLSDIVLGLSGNKETILKAYEKLGQENMAVLDSIAHSLNVDIIAHSSAFAKKFKKLEEWEIFLGDLADYLGEFAQICESESRSVAAERLLVESKAKRLGEDRKSLRNELNRMTKSLDKAEYLLKLADRQFESADEIAKTYEVEHLKFLQESQAKIKELDLLEKTLLADRRAVEVIRGDLLKRHRRLESERKHLEAIKRDIIKQNGPSKT